MRNPSQQEQLASRLQGRELMREFEGCYQEYRKWQRKNYPGVKPATREDWALRHQQSGGLFQDAEWSEILLTLNLQAMHTPGGRR